MKVKESVYDNFIIKKPWGKEYVIYRNKKEIAVTILFIKYKKSTSLHCHPKKKTGFVLLDGKAKIQLGLYNSGQKVFNRHSKLMIRNGLFHKTSSLSKEGLIALEFETPVDKNDLVRFSDSFGRKKLPYETGKFFEKKRGKDIIKVNKSAQSQTIKVKNRVFYYEVHKNFKKIIKYKDTDIFGILSGTVVDSQNKSVLNSGDIVKTGTLRKLSKRFKIGKELKLFRFIK